MLVLAINKTCTRPTMYSYTTRTKTYCFAESLQMKRPMMIYNETFQGFFYCAVLHKNCSCKL